MKVISTKIWIPILIIVLLTVDLSIFFNWSKEKNPWRLPFQKKETPKILADWKTYRNEKYRFEIKYPEDWEVTEEIEKEETTPYYHLAGVFPSAEEVPTKKFTIRMEPKICLDFRKKDSERCILFYSIYIEVYPEASIDSTEEYRKRIITAKCIPGICFEIREDSIRNVKLGNMMAFRYIGGYLGQLDVYNLVYDKKLYVVTSLGDFFSEERKSSLPEYLESYKKTDEIYEYYIPLVRQILSTFKFIE